MFAMLAAATIGLGVAAERVDWSGWRGCVRLRNSEVELIVVPQIGRIMHFGRIGGPNLLFVNADLTGQPGGGDWKNFGGDKIWNAPQSVWVWPPDVSFEQMPHDVRIEGDTVRMVSPVSKRFGIRFERTIRLGATGTRVEFVNRLTNVGKAPVEWGLWQVTQIAGMEYAGMILTPTAEFSRGWSPYPDVKLNPGEVSVNGQSATAPVPIFPGAELQVRIPAQGGFKVGGPPIPFAVYGVWANDRLVLSAKPERGGAFPDEGRARQLYAQASPPYIELELAGHVKKIAPGANIRFDTAWEIVPIRKR